VAVREPLAVGLKVTVIEQVAFGAVEAEQVLVWVKSGGSAPPMAKLVIPSDVPPTLVKVTDLVPVPEFVFSVPKLRLLALNAGTGSMTVALSMTVCGLPAALSVPVQKGLPKPPFA
jgi:hypothetical protein